MRNMEILKLRNMDSEDRSQLFLGSTVDLIDKNEYSERKQKIKILKKEHLS